MFNWMLKKLAKPVVTLLVQGYKVSTLIESTIKEVLPKLVQGTVTYERLSTIYVAVALVSVVLKKTIIFLGGEVPVVNQSEASLHDEIEKLKKLI